MKTVNLSLVSVSALEKALTLKQRIQRLESRVMSILTGSQKANSVGATAGEIDRRTLPKSAATRAKMSAGIRASWRRRKRATA